MPLFNTKCPDCGDVREDVILKFKERPGPCVKCGKEVRKMMPTGTGIKLKGAGWARDNYGCI